MTEASKKVFYFLQKHYGEEFTKYKLSELLNLSMAQISGSVNGLVKKGYAKERIESNPPLVFGKAPIEIRWVTLTELGKDFDPEEEEARQIRQAAIDRAARKAERIRQKAERARMNSVL